MKKDEWTPSGGICLEQAAINAVRCEDNALVDAGPGAGKTELLAQKAGYLFTTSLCKAPRKILAISFKKDSADNLKERIVARYGERYKNRFLSLTYDAFFKSILDRFYRALPEEYSVNSRYAIADSDKLLLAFEIAGYHEFKDQRPSDAKKMAVELLNKCTLPVTDARMKRVWNIMRSGTESYTPALSFNMIAKLALFIVQNNPQIKRIIRATFSHVFLDEFQDTTNIQYDIVKELFENTEVKLTAVGDNKQRIMLWAGARKTVFDDYTRSFNAHCFKLLMNHRSAPRLVELQKRMYASLNDNPNSISASPKWDEDEGIINLIIADNNNLEAQELVKLISNDIKGGIKPQEIAILCKQKIENYAGGIISELRGNGIRSRIETEYQDLLKDDVIRILLSVISLAFDRKLPEEREYVQGIVEQCMGIEGASIDKYYSMITRLDELFINVKSQLLDVDSLEAFCLVRKTIIGFLGEDKIKALFPENKQGHYLEDKLNKFSELFWNEYLSSGSSWENAVRAFKGENCIPVMTIHKSKGLEYEAVYFVGLEDSAFWNFKSQPEEDRCAFFVALSRAKRSVTFTFCKYRYGFKYPRQNRTNVNEFYELLQQPNMANVMCAEEL